MAGESSCRKWEALEDRHVRSRASTMKFLNKHLEALATAALVLFSLMAVGCSSGKERSTAYTAEAVYLNEANSISILVRDPVDNSLSVKRIQTQFDMVFKDDIVDSRVHP